MRAGPPCPARPRRAAPGAGLGHGWLAGFTGRPDSAADGIRGFSDGNNKVAATPAATPCARSRCGSRPLRPPPGLRCLASLPRLASLFLLCCDLETKQRGPPHRGPRVVPVARQPLLEWRGLCFAARAGVWPRGVLAPLFSGEWSVAGPCAAEDSPVLFSVLSPEHRGSRAHRLPLWSWL